MPLGSFAAATDASPAIRYAGTLLKTVARRSLIALVLSLLIPSTPAHAATFTVTNLIDSGAGSLREAITNANAAPGADTIFFSVSGTITLASALPTITDGLTINGGGQVLTISGNNAVRVMQVDPVKSLTLHRVTIANGNAAGASGGGIDNRGTLTITNSTFSGNSAAGVGGGIYNIGTLTITNSTFSGNSAADIGLSGAGGGGIYNAGTLTITNSTFSGNTTLRVGGGIANFSNQFGSLTITNSTFSGNSAPNDGGAGIFNGGVDTVVTLRNTIVANSAGGNCGGPITNGGNNIDSGTTCGWGAVSGSKSSTNPLLGPLANNFAETQTFALLTGSPAIDGVTFSPPNSAPSTDQRGVPRPQGGGYDIGAFELAPGALFMVNTTADTDDFFCDVLGGGSGNNHDCTLREAIDAADAAVGPDTITFSVSGTITLASMLPAIDDGNGLTIDGTGQTLTVSGNHAVRVMQVSANASLTLNNVTIANGASDTGGGVFNSGSVTITNSTFSGNSAGNGSGGGIYNTGTLTITNSTFSGNSASPFPGGGIYTFGTLTITNSTFSGNSATGGFGGAGIHNAGSAAVTLRNTIVANSAGPNCGGAITNGGNNIDSGTTCGWGAVSGSMSSTNPLLGALASNGGPTQTFALLTGSPAIHGVMFNAPNSAPSTDQRGVARPQGVRYDIGAYEFTGAQAGPALMVNAVADTNDGFCSIPGEGSGNHDCTLREAINAANALAGANTITFSVSGTITLVGSQLPSITDAAGLTMDGTGQTLTISGNNAVRVMEVSAGASLTLNSLTIANGTVTETGGGLLNGGTATITNSTFSANIATGGGGIFSGGGTLTITNSTFSGNSGSGGTGGGIYSGGGTLTITNTTFSNNSAIFGGGVFASAATSTITNSTFSGNASVGGNAVFNNGGAVVTLRNTVLANLSASGENCSGAITNGGNNIDSGTTCGWGAASGSMSNTNPLLGGLANNGGPTRTFALLTGSPAIDGVTFTPPNGAPSTDQRGLARPQGARFDIGAYELLGTQAGPDFMVNAGADTNDGVCDSPGQGFGNHDCTLREAINAANTLAGASTIAFSVGGTITLASTLPAITDAAGLTMDGTGQTLTISGNNAVRVMQVGAGASLTLNNLTIANGTGSGGGIANSGAVTITNSTFSGNSATSGAGGAINNGGDGTLTITNSTFSGNSATNGSGGGVFGNGGTLTITNSTFSGNSATGGFGAAIKNNAVAGVIVRNSIVANSVGAGNCNGAITNGANNIDDGATCGWSAVSGSMSTINPLLGALSYNGGRTQTFALLPGSPAIDGVTFSAPNSAPSTDQRGLVRPRGLRYDIGPYETQFTDDPLTAGLTIVKAVHVTELRIRIDAVRIAKGLAAYAWTDLSLGPSGWVIRAQHIIDLRTALSEAYVQAARTPPAYAVDPPPSLVPGLIVKAAHIAEIRTALLAIE